MRQDSGGSQALFSVALHPGKCAPTMPKARPEIIKDNASIQPDAVDMIVQDADDPICQTFDRLFHISFHRPD